MGRRGAHGGGGPPRRRAAARVHAAAQPRRHPLVRGARCPVPSARQTLPT